MGAELTGGPLSPEELTAAKIYMRVDRDDDAVNADITACILAAREYMDGVGVALPDAGTGRRALYDLVCHAMALSSYDQRDPVITGTIVTENPQLRRMLTQLKLTEPQE